MDTSWIKTYCLSLKGCEHDYKVEWDAQRYLLHNKLFVMHGTDKTGRPIITVKLEPAYGELLRKEYSEIVPGYYMNKLHWNSFYLDSNVPIELMKACIDQSYEIVLNQLPKYIKNSLV